MFRLLRNREVVKRYLLIGIFAIMSIGMVLAMTPFFSGDTSRVDNSALAEIFGDSITSQDLQRDIDLRFRNSPQGYNPQQAALMAGPILDQMVMDRALTAQAHQLGIKASPQEVLKAAQAIPGIYQNGVFIGKDRFEQMTGASLSQFEEELRQKVLLDKLKAVITGGVEVTPQEVRQETLRRDTKAKIEYALFDPSQFLKEVKITPDALEAFFKKSPERYKISEERRIRYVLIDAASVRAQTQASEDELRRSYDLHRADYRVPDRVKAAHILFKTTGKAPAQAAAIEKTARQVLAEVRSGKDFAELAKKYSEDSSAGQGGDIGWIVRGQTVKEFEDAAFSMKPGEVSDLIKTIYGFHIIKLLDKQSAHLRTFDEVKEEIRADLENQKRAQAEQALADNLVRQFGQDPRNFEATARKAGLEPKMTPPIRFGEIVPDFGSSESFSNLAFQLGEGKTGTPITVPKGLAIIQVVEILPAHLPKLDEVRARVELDYKAAQAKQLSDDKAKELAAKAQNGEFKALAKNLSLIVKESKEFTRQDFVEGVGSGTQLADAFTLQVAQTSKAVNLGANSVVFRLKSRTPPDEADIGRQRDQITEDLLQRKRDVAFEVYQKNLKQQLLLSGKLKMNDAAMKQFLAAYRRGS